MTTEGVSQSQQWRILHIEYNTDAIARQPHAGDESDHALGAGVASDDDLPLLLFCPIAGSDRYTTIRRW